MHVTEEHTVVAGIDGSSSAVRAAVWAGAEAVHRRLALRLVQVCTVPRAGLTSITGPLEQIRAGLAERADTWLGEAKTAVLAVHPGLTVELAAREWNPVAALVQESERAQLVVLGSRGLGGFTELLLGSTAVALAGHGHCPVLVVRGRDELAVNAPVVVGVDGSRDSDDAIAFACDEASARGVALTAVHTWNHAFSGGPVHPYLSAVDLAELERDQRNLLARHLDGWQEKYPDVAMSAVVREGPPATTLLDYATNAQLIVVGSRGLGGFKGMLLGSTSQALVLHAPCPVAIVRPYPDRDRDRR